jgi:L-amino acid N-acyltransferase YncA
MAGTIRLATEDDAEQIQAIYAPYVRDTAISFEIEPPSVEEMRQRVIEVLQRAPWLVCEHAGAVLGYAYAGKYRVRAAYQWSVDVSVYIDPSAHRRGIGRGLYTSLMALLHLQGYYNAYAGITLPNPASVGLHEALGFVPVGVYHQVGHKLGAWHDVGWWQRALRAHTRAPKPPADLSTIRASPAYDDAMAAGIRLLRD